MFKENKEYFKLIRKAHLDYLYLEYLNRKLAITFKDEYSNENAFMPYIYAGILFNVSMAWLDTDCKEDYETLAKTVIETLSIK